jgi:hypothetical protein
MLLAAVEGPQSSRPAGDALRRRVLDLIAEGVLPHMPPEGFTIRPSHTITSCIACDARFALGEAIYEAVSAERLVRPLHRSCFMAWLREVG